MRSLRADARRFDPLDSDNSSFSVASARTCTNSPSTLSSTKMPPINSNNTAEALAARVWVFCVMGSAPAPALERTERQRQAEADHREEVDDVAGVDHAAHQILEMVVERDPLDDRRSG